MGRYHKKKHFLFETYLLKEIGHKITLEFHNMIVVFTRVFICLPSGLGIEIFDTKKVKYQICPKKTQQLSNYESSPVPNLGFPGVNVKKQPTFNAANLSLIS